MTSLRHWICACGFCLCVWPLVGCGPAPAPTRSASSTPSSNAGTDAAAEIAAAIGTLSPEDQALAKAQGYCAVSEEPLGSMGPPVKLVLNDQPVFVCCEGCNKRANANPDATVAKSETLKARVKAESK